jgi:hypothetical protein
MVKHAHPFTYSFLSQTQKYVLMASRNSVWESFDPKFYLLWEYQHIVWIIDV